MKGKQSDGPSKGEIAKDEAPRSIYAGAGSEVVKSAMKKKRGGSVKKAKHVAAHGEMAKHRLDRPARKAGGRVGSDMKPLSSAANVKTPAGRDVDQDYD